jgi:hypothetical protein
MHTRPNPQLGLMDSLMTIPANDFLDRLDQLVDWRPLERALHAMYPATTGRPPHPPLVLFKMSLLQALLRPVGPAVRAAGARPALLAALRGTRVAGQCA